jgi:short-subunit dehydrogenase
MKKTAIITGGSGLLGKEIIKFLSKKYNVINLSRTNTITPCDICEAVQIANYVHYLSSVDLLINNAGVMLYDSFSNIKEIDFDKTFLTNVKGAFLVTQTVLPLMPRGSYIINISSIRGITGAPNKAIYSASKFALQGLMDSLRKELKDSGIKITNICPGKISESVTTRDIVKTINYILSLSDETFIRDIILGGVL